MQGEGLGRQAAWLLLLPLPLAQLYTHLLPDNHPLQLLHASRMAQVFPFTFDYGSPIVRSC